eukprot:COSAG03_NODE_1611_length_3776_cov_92.161817_3_plen_555_part_00
MQAVGSWSKDACCSIKRNTCCSAPGCGYCWDKQSSDDFIFRLCPEPAQRFNATKGAWMYQQIHNHEFGTWGGYGALAIADLNAGTGFCDQGHDYSGEPNQICGGHANWGLTDLEVWRPAMHAPEPAPAPPTPKPSQSYVCCDSVDKCEYRCFHNGTCLEHVQFPEPSQWCDCTDTGYHGQECHNPDSVCCDERCLQRCFNHGKCLSHRQPDVFCDCSGTGFSGESCRTPGAGTISTLWQTVCVIVTACGSLSLACFVRHHIHTLRSLRPIRLPDNDRMQSYGGAFLFICGVVDLLLSVNTCYNLFSCKQLEGNIVLALCFLAALVVNYSATIALAFYTLDYIRKTRHVPSLTEPLRARASTTSSTTGTVLRFRSLLPLLVVGTIPRFQSLAILRLRLFGATIFDYPMEDCHLFFIRNSGLHHVFVADIPVVVVGLALIHSAVDDIQSPCQGDSLDWTRATLWCKCVLIVWNFVSATTQLLLTGNCGTNVRGGREHNGILHVETVASVMRSTAGSLRTTADHRDRTSRWVDDVHSTERQSDGSTHTRSSIQSVCS